MVRVVGQVLFFLPENSLEHGVENSTMNAGLCLGECVLGQGRCMLMVCALRDGE